LNNDTLVPANTLKELVYCMESDETIGLVGAVIYFSDRPSKVQAYGGGKIMPVFGVDRFVRSPGRSHYVSGTSLLVKREVVGQIGLLDEGFFFYWEDVDFSRRALDKGWKAAVCPNAFVYHKFSASVEGQSLKSDLFKAASLVRYFRKHYKVRWILPVTLNILGMVVNRLLRGQFSRIFPILREVFITTTL
jgi:GT2 family glycosyltransferase